MKDLEGRHYHFLAKDERDVAAEVKEVPTGVGCADQIELNKVEPPENVLLDGGKKKVLSQGLTEARDKSKSRV